MSYYVKDMFWLDHLKNIGFYQIIMNRERSDKAGFAAFKEKYMKASAEIQLVGQPSPCKEIAEACRTGNILKYAWWWAVWTATKDRGHLDNKYWDDADRMSARDLLPRLKSYLALLDTKDINGKYIYDVFRNPFSDTEHFETASLPIIRAIQCLEPFVLSDSYLGLQ